MEIKCPDGGDGGRQDFFPSTHEELHPTSMLSVIANLTPWSDHNQSPRNMYQCQVCILDFLVIFGTLMSNLCNLSDFVGICIELCSLIPDFFV